MTAIVSEAAIIEHGYAPNDYILDLNRSLTVPYDRDYPAPWNLPSRLFRFPLEVGHAVEGMRRIGLMHPAIGDHPFVQEVTAALNVQPDPDGAPNQHGVKKGMGEWWHAVDLMTAGLWRELLATRRFTTDDDIAHAVEFALGCGGKRKLSLSEAREIMAAINAPELPDPLPMLRRLMKPHGLREAPKSAERWPINGPFHCAPADRAWLRILGLERGWFSHDKQGFIGWTELGRAQYEFDHLLVAPPAKAVPADHRATMAGRVAPRDDNADLFLTAPWGGRSIGEIIRRIDPSARTAWECACGPGTLVHGLSDYFDEVYASDLFNYGWGHRLYDFMSDEPAPFVADWIITNPPFGKKIIPFIRNAVRRSRRGCAMLVQLRVLAGQERYAVFQAVGLSHTAVFAERIAMVAGRYDPTASTATEYVWLIFQKPQRRGAPLPTTYQGLTIPPGTKARLMRLSDFRFAVSDGVMPASVLPPIDGARIEEHHLAALTALAKCGPRGSCSVPGVIDGGAIAACVQFGLAERTAADRLGGNRYVTSETGLTVLRAMGRFPERRAA